MIDRLPSFEQVKNYLRNRRSRRQGGATTSDGLGLSLSLNNLFGGHFMAATAGAAANYQTNDFDEFDVDEIGDFGG